jgi:hypothetical protein
LLPGERQENCFLMSSSQTWRGRTPSANLYGASS